MEPLTHQEERRLHSWDNMEPTIEITELNRHMERIANALGILAYNSITRDMPKDVNGRAEWQAVDNYLADVLVFERRRSSATMKY